MQERLKRWTGRSFATGAKGENLTTPFDAGFIYDSLDKGTFTPSEEGNAKNSLPFHERACYAIPKFAMKILTPQYCLFHSCSSQYSTPTRPALADKMDSLTAPLSPSKFPARP